MIHTRIFINDGGWMSNKIICWIRVMCAINNRPDKDGIMVYFNWPMMRDAITLSQCINATPNLRGFRMISHTELETCLGYCQCDDIWNRQVDNDLAHEFEKQIVFSDAIKLEVEELKVSREYIGAHVRYGKNKPPGSPPGPWGLRAPESYYTDLMDHALMRNPKQKFFLASDATAEELLFLSSRYNLLHSKPDAHAAVDLLALSKCSIIIGSLSTFSRLAGGIGGIQFTWPDHGSDHGKKVMDDELFL